MDSHDLDDIILKFDNNKVNQSQECSNLNYIKDYLINFAEYIKCNLLISNILSELHVRFYISD